MMQAIHIALILLCIAVLVAVTIRTIQDWWLERQRERRVWNNAEHLLIAASITRVDRGEQ